VLFSDIIRHYHKGQVDFYESIFNVPPPVYSLGCQATGKGKKVKVAHTLLPSVGFQS